MILTPSSDGVLLFLHLFLMQFWTKNLVKRIFGLEIYIKFLIFSCFLTPQNALKPHKYWCYSIWTIFFEEFGQFVLVDGIVRLYL